MTSNVGAVETTSSCVFWLTGKSGYQEFISEKPSADPVYAYMKVKTEDIGYGEIYKTDKSTVLILKVQYMASIQIVTVKHLLRR